MGTKLGIVIMACLGVATLFFLWSPNLIGTASSGSGEIVLTNASRTMEPSTMGVGDTVHDFTLADVWQVEGLDRPYYSARLEGALRVRGTLQFMADDRHYVLVVNEAYRDGLPVAYPSDDTRYTFYIYDFMSTPRGRDVSDLVFATRHVPDILCGVEGIFDIGHIIISNNPYEMNVLVCRFVAITSITPAARAELRDRQ